MPKSGPTLMTQKWYEILTSAACVVSVLTPEARRYLMHASLIVLAYSTMLFLPGVVTLGRSKDEE